MDGATSATNAGGGRLDRWAGRRSSPASCCASSPARAVRALTDRELAEIRVNALQYVARPSVPPDASRL